MKRSGTLGGYEWQPSRYRLYGLLRTPSSHAEEAFLPAPSPLVQSPQRWQPHLYIWNLWKPFFCLNVILVYAATLYSSFNARDINGSFKKVQSNGLNSLKKFNYHIKSSLFVGKICGFQIVKD